MSQGQRATEAPPGVAAMITFRDPSVLASLNRTSGELTWFGSDGQLTESAPSDQVLFIGSAGTLDEALIAGRSLDSSVELELPHVELDSAETIFLRIIFLTDDPLVVMISEHDLPVNLLRIVTDDVAADLRAAEDSL